VRWRIQFVVRTSLQDFRNQGGKRSLNGRVSFPDFNQSISFAVSFATEGQREELRRRRDTLKLKRLHLNVLLQHGSEYEVRLCLFFLLVHSRASFDTWKIEMEDWCRRNNLWTPIFEKSSAKRKASKCRSQAFAALCQAVKNDPLIHRGVKFMELRELSNPSPRVASNIFGKRVNHLI
jgi:hypothetical protein